MTDRILVINPNWSTEVTRHILLALEGYRFPGGPEIDCVTIAEGPPGIEMQVHVEQVVLPMCRLVDAERPRTDAFVIACFSDPGLYAVRERAGVPVIGIAQAGFSQAMLLGDRFGVIAILDRSVKRHLRYVASLGLGDRLAGDRAIGLGVAELSREDVAFARMVEVGEQLKADGADVVVLGCAGMARYRDRLEERLAVPVDDPSQAAVAQAIGILRARGARRPALAAAGE